MSPLSSPFSHRQLGNAYQSVGVHEIPFSSVVILRQEDLGGRKCSSAVVLGTFGLLNQFQGTNQIKIVNSESTKSGGFYYHICSPQLLAQYNIES